MVQGWPQVFECDRETPWPLYTRTKCKEQDTLGGQQESRAHPGVHSLRLAWPPNPLLEGRKWNSLRLFLRPAQQTMIELSCCKDQGAAGWGSQRLGEALGRISGSEMWEGKAIWRRDFKLAGQRGLLLNARTWRCREGVTFFLAQYCTCDCDFAVSHRRKSRRTI